MSLGTLLGQVGIVVQFHESLISGICFQQCFRWNMNMGFLEQPEIMFSPIRKGKADNLPILEIYQHLRFQCVLLFLPRIVPFLLFLGRSTGDSVASTRITSYSISLFSGAFRPGKENVPSRINVSSTHFIPR